MIPNKSLSTQVVYSPYLASGITPQSELVDYEMGGINLSDTSEGLWYQKWTATLKGEVGKPGTEVWISAPNHPESLLLEQDNLTRVSLSFDQNMHPCLAYEQAGNAYFWWYNAGSAEYQTLALPETASSPYCTLDDKREIPLLLGITDILLLYVNNDSLCYRQQRDTYDTEYILLTNLSEKLSNPSIRGVAMNEGFRIMPLLQGNLYQ